MTVKIYTTPTCPYCQMAKEYFKSRKIAYEEVDVSTNQEAAQEMVDMSGQMGVPVIEINGHVIVGFNREAIEHALEHKEGHGEHDH